MDQAQGKLQRLQAVTTSTGNGCQDNRIPRLCGEHIMATTARDAYEVRPEVLDVADDRHAPHEREGCIRCGSVIE